MLSRNTMVVEILRAAQEEVKRTELVRCVQAMTGYSMAAICRMLGISRSTAYRQSRERPLVYARAEDRHVLEEVRTITRQMESYGYPRVTVRVNRRLFGRSYNEKRSVA